MLGFVQFPCFKTLSIVTPAFVAVGVDADLQLCGLKILVSTPNSFIMILVQRAMVSLCAALMVFSYVIKRLFIDVSPCRRLFHLLMYSVINLTGRSLIFWEYFLYVIGLWTYSGLECFKSLHGIKVHSVVVSCTDSTENVVREFIISPPSNNKSITIFSDNNFIDNIPGECATWCWWLHIKNSFDESLNERVFWYVWITW